MAYRRFGGYSKKITEYKWGIALVSFIAVVLVALAIFSQGFRNWDFKTWFNTDVQCEHVFEDGKCTLCDELEVSKNEENKDVNDNIENQDVNVNEEESNNDNLKE